MGGRRETSLVAMLSRVVCDGFLLTELRGIRCVCLLEDNPPWRRHRLSIFSPSSELHAFTLRLWHHVPFALEVLSPFLHTPSFTSNLDVPSGFLSGSVRYPLLSISYRRSSNGSRRDRPFSLVPSIHTPSFASTSDLMRRLGRLSWWRCSFPPLFHSYLAPAIFNLFKSLSARHHTTPSAASGRLGENILFSHSRPA